MWQIKVAIRDKLYADTTFKNVTGAVASDKRVYSHWVGEEKELSSSKPGYVTIYELPGGPQDANKSQEFYSLDIWGISDEVCDKDIYPCLRRLLHRQPLSVAGVSMKRVEINTKFDQSIEEDKAWHKVVQLRILYAE